MSPLDELTGLGHSWRAEFDGTGLIDEGRKVGSDIYVPTWAWLAAVPFYDARRNTVEHSAYTRAVLLRLQADAALREAWCGYLTLCEETTDTERREWLEALVPR